MFSVRKFESYPLFYLSIYFNIEINQSTFRIFDERGCPSDSNLFGEIQYSDELLLAYARATVFAIRSESMSVPVQSIQFSCNVSICLRNAQPPQFDSVFQRKRRAENSLFVHYK